MALKDWKKAKYTIKGVDLFFIDKPNSEEITITNYKTVHNMPLEYEVRIHIGFTVKSRKYFKTKTKALAYAKSYMRKH